MPTALAGRHHGATQLLDSRQFTEESNNKIEQQPSRNPFVPALKMAVQVLCRKRSALNSRQRSFNSWQDGPRIRLVESDKDMVLTRTLTTYACIALLTALLVDVVAYSFLPRPLTAVLGDYRKPGTSQARQSLRNSYPANYYFAHPTRGHDITPSGHQRHYVHELGYYDVWSNDLGCFDNPVNDGELNAAFIYLAGDSFTWGFTPFAAHFGSLLQTRVGVRTIKCGVAGTGQRHQFEKFLETTTRLGRLPALVIVSVVANDIDDDYAYPAFAVIDGWLTATKELDPANDLVEVPEETIRQRMKDYFTQVPTSTTQEIKAWLIEHSLSLNLLRSAWRAVKNRNVDEVAAANTVSTPAASARRGFWTLSGDYDHYPSDVTRISAANLGAIETWQKHAQQNNYQLLVSIIAYTKVPGYKDYFADFRSRLNTMGVCVVDSSLAIATHGDPSGYYWSIDGHFNPDGHRFYTDFLADVLSDMYSGTRLEARHRNTIGQACIPPVGMHLSNG